MPYPCPCCEPPTCLYGSDNFNRSPNDIGIEGPGLDWQPYSAGVFSDGTKLIMSAMNDFCAYLVPHPDGLNTSTVDVIAHGTTAGDELRVNMDFVNSSPFDRVYAQVKYGAAGTGIGGTLSLWRREASVHTELRPSIIYPFIPGQDYNLTARISICDDDLLHFQALICTTLGDHDFPLAVISVQLPGTNASPYVGLSLGAMTSGSGNVCWFDEFSVYKSYDPDTAPTCEKCRTDCTSVCAHPAAEFDVTLGNWEDADFYEGTTCDIPACSNLNGTWRLQPLITSPCWWYHHFDEPLDLCEGFQNITGLFMHLVYQDGSGVGTTAGVTMLVGAIEFGTIDAVPVIGGGSNNLRVAFAKRWVDPTAIHANDSNYADFDCELPLTLFPASGNDVSITYGTAFVGFFLCISDDATCLVEIVP